MSSCIVCHGHGIEQTHCELVLRVLTQLITSWQDELIVMSNPVDAIAARGEWGQHVLIAIKKP